MLQVGDKFSKFGLDGVVLTTSGPTAASFTGAMADGTTMWFGAGQSHVITDVELPVILEEFLPPTVSTISEGGKRIRARLSDPLPHAVSSLFIDHLKNGYKLRLLYSAAAEKHVKDWFQENGLDLEQIAPGIVPVKSQMQSVAGTLTFPVPEEDTSFLPPTLRYIPRKNNLEVNDVRLVVALMRLGLALNDYTGRKKAK